MRISLTPKEAADSIGVDVQTIYKAVKSGELAAKRGGTRRILISVTELEAWFDALPSYEEDL